MEKNIAVRLSNHQTSDIKSWHSEHSSALRHVKSIFYAISQPLYLSVWKQRQADLSAASCRFQLTHEIKLYRLHLNLAENIKSIHTDTSVHLWLHRFSTQHLKCIMSFVFYMQTRSVKCMFSFHYFSKCTLWQIHSLKVFSDLLV